MPTLAEFELDGKRYVWNGWRWLPEDSREAPPKPVLHRLNRLLARSNQVRLESSQDPRELLGLAIRARNGGIPGRAERFARKVLKSDPENAVATAIISSVLREKGRPKEALAITERLQGSNDPFVLTTRAAALCDLKRWGEGLPLIRHALEIETQRQGGESEEAIAVLGRIQGSAPHLFEEEVTERSPGSGPACSAQ